MRNRLAYLIVVGLLATGYWLLTPGSADPAASPAPAGGRNIVAVVSVPQVFRDSKEIRSVYDEFKKRADALKTEVDNRSKLLGEREEDVRKKFAEDSKDFKDRMREIVSERINLRVSMEEKRQDLVSQHQARTADFYGRMSKVIETLARGDGFDVVLYKEEMTIKDAKSPDELLAMMRERKILYNTARADITATVIEKLDLDWSASPKNK